jgi:hypothetical protein
MTLRPKSKFDQIMNFHRHFPPVQQIVRTFETGVDVSKPLGQIVKPGKQSPSFLNMAPAQALEYIIDIFREKGQLSKQEFVDLCQKALKRQSPCVPTVASFFDSMDTSE